MDSQEYNLFDFPLVTSLFGGTCKVYSNGYLVYVTFNRENYKFTANSHSKAFGYQIINDYRPITPICSVNQGNHNTFIGISTDGNLFYHCNSTSDVTSNIRWSCMYVKQSALP